MEKKLIKKIEEKLKNEKKKIETELKEFAKKKKNSWEVNFPNFNGGESGSGILEKGADEVEEYTTRLSLKSEMEKKLKEIDLALEKIKKGIYGICEKCQKEIEKERLEIYPESRFCLKCKKINL
jgi:DnaK suppressor protein